MKDWKLGVEGFVMQYLLAGPEVEPFSSGRTARDQLTLEAELRKEIVSPLPQEKEVRVRLGECAQNGCPWTVYAPFGSGMIDVSDFYSTLQRVNLEAAVSLWTEEPLEIHARVWTYMAAGVYCNGKLVCRVEYPVYKPIEFRDFSLKLEKGGNLLYLYAENLGVRDTRNILGIQILDHREEIRVRLPDEREQREIWEAAAFLGGLSLSGRTLHLPEAMPEKTGICFLPESPDYEVMARPREWKPLQAGADCEVEGTAVVRVRGNRWELSRKLEYAMGQKPLYRPASYGQADCFRSLMEEIASVSSLNRGEFGFSIFNILARKYLGCEAKEDRERLFDTLRLIEQRVDCSDFLLCGLLRYVHCYGLDEELAARTKEVLLSYRYWMNMEGTDAMCFWSENHSLMFYLSAMDAGSLYPEESFLRAGMTGRELSRYGRKKVVEWLDDVEQYGFEEFLSTVYLCVTFAALLHAIDFADEEISSRARAVADDMLTCLARQAFRGCVIAPMGRVYRDVIYPFSQGTQSVLNLIDPSAPVSYGEGWMAFLATSTYRFPQGLAQQMHRDADEVFSCGNAQIVLKKTADYCLTSVQSPRTDGRPRWNNIRRDPAADPDSHAFTRSLNECFHGTSCFQPGVYGYQQHLWYAALSPEAVLFVNHPGTAAEESDMRPGYWNGNGVIPAIRQEGEILGLIYRIPDSHPIGFTHVYCPRERFREVTAEPHWLYLAQDDGYLALWCSGEMTPYDDTIFGCEQRVYGRETAYVCVCASRKEYATLGAFAAYVQGLEPTYCAAQQRLELKNGFTLLFEACEDETQYVE